MTLFREHGAISFIWNFVFLFHLPVFFFVAGYFSKIGPDEPIKAFKKLFIPYIIFCITWELFSIYVMGDSPNSKLFINPGYVLWFLMSLFAMKMFLPIIDRLKYPLVIAIIGALLIGFIDSNILGISRTFVYLPMFILGFKYNHYKEMFINEFPIIESKKFAILIAILTIIASVILSLYFDHNTVIMKFTYSNNFLVDILSRGAVIFVATINVLVLTRFMTNRKIMLTQMGINSFTVYVLHPYFMELSKMIAKPYLKNHIKLTIVFIFGMSFILTYLLSRDIFTKALNKIFNLAYKVLCIE